MRFVPTNCLKSGMLVGDTLWNTFGDPMLCQGEILTEDYIAAIKKHNYSGVLIDDDISKNIHTINVINEGLRLKTVRGIKDLFISAENGNSFTKESIRQTKDQVEVLVDEIFANKDLMVNMVDLKVFDDYTYYHSVNVSILSIVLGVALGMSKGDLCNLGYGAILHDIGKVFISKDIINKPGKLTDYEFEEIKKHTLLGCEYIKTEYEVPDSSYMAIMDHHERYMGGGYPNNKRGEDISMYGRIIALADVYDALTSNRPYRKAVLPSEAMEYIMASTMTLFDPTVVEVFVRKIAPYPVGTCVKLSNDQIGIVAENYENYCMRPKIKVFNDKGKDIDPYVVDLIDNSSLNITVIDVL